MHKNLTKVTKNEDGSTTLEIPISKIDQEERVVTGVVYEPDTVDAQGDSASAEEIRKASFNFMMKSMILGFEHKESISKFHAQIVENYIAPTSFKLGEQFIKAGTWLMSIKIHNDELWALIKSGEVSGFSMSGRCRAG